MKSTITVKTIAEKLGISSSTVSRALSDHPRIGIRTKEKVKELAKKLNYVANPASEYLKTGKTMSVGFLVPSLKETYFSTILFQLENLLAQAGYHVVLFQSLEDMDREIAGSQFFLRLRVDAVVVSLAASTNNYLHFKQLENCGIPVIFIDRVPRNFQAHTIECEMKKSEVESMELLKQMGIQKVGFINGPSNLAASDKRLNSYLTGILKCGFESSPRLIKTCDLTLDGVQLAIHEILSDYPDLEAIVCFNDIIAMYAAHIVTEKKMAQQHIHFIGHGNLSINPYLAQPPLASIEQFPEKMGQMAAKLFFKLMDMQGEDVPYFNWSFDSELIIRDCFVQN